VSLEQPPLNLQTMTINPNSNFFSSSKMEPALPTPPTRTPTTPILLDHELHHQPIKHFSPFLGYSQTHYPRPQSPPQDQCSHTTTKKKKIIFQTFQRSQP